jgi:hypothetical protein
MSTSDLNWNRNKDQQTYGRTRGRFDIVGEVGQAKAVFGFEIDAIWGQTGFIDSNNGPGCVTSGTTSAVTCGAVGNGAESSFDLNTDTQAFQIKWVYVEFPLPLVPIPIIRVSAVALRDGGSYKLATYATGDQCQPGATISPTFKAQFTYVMVDENLTGKGTFGPVLAGTGSLQNKACTSRDGDRRIAASTVTNNCTAQSRGDNWAIIASPEITVMKGWTSSRCFRPSGRGRPQPVRVAAV